MPADVAPGGERDLQLQRDRARGGGDVFLQVAHGARGARRRRRATWGELDTLEVVAICDHLVALGAAALER